MTFDALISLGGNTGDVVSAFSFANSRLCDHSATSSFATSKPIRSAPMGGKAGGTFWNAATHIRTTLDPAALLDLLQEIENEAGRVRDIRWGPRTLDLDLILFGDAVIRTNRLAVPHPSFFFRRFVIAPAFDLVPGLRDPVSGFSIADFYARLDQTPYRILVDETEIDDLTVETFTQAFRSDFPNAEFVSINQSRPFAHEFASQNCDSTFLQPQGDASTIAHSHPERMSNSDFGKQICPFGCSLGLTTCTKDDSNRFWIQLKSKTEDDLINEVRWILQAAVSCSD